MAEEKEPHDPMKDVYFFITIVIIIVILWFAAGGPGKADVGGAFLHAPQPLDSGASYGPTFQTGTVAPPGQVQY